MLVALLALLLGQAAPPAAPTFGTLDIVVDSQDEPLAAYQLDLRDASGAARIVGIEGGEHPAFREPPRYDPRAIENDRAILAAWSTRPAAELPTDATRLVTVHYMTQGSPKWELTLVAAGDAEGRRIDATATVR